MNDHSNAAAGIAYDDLREWLSHAERLGELRTVNGQAGRQTSASPRKRCCARKTARACCPTRYRGCPKGFRVLLNVFAGKHRNMTLGFPDRLTKSELSDAFREAYLQDQRTASATDET